MKKRYKLHFILILFLSFYFNIGTSQTFVGLNIGGDYYDVSEKMVSTFVILENKNKSSFLFGLFIEQNLNRSLNLVLRSDFTSKKHIAYWDYSSGGFIYDPILGYNYKSINTRLMMSWNFFNNFHLGVGGGFNHIFDSRMVLLYGGEDKYGEAKKNIIEGITGISYTLKNFSINLYYNYGFNFGDETFPEFDKFNSIVFSLGYRVKVFDKVGKKKGKGKDCPEF